MSTDLYWRPAPKEPPPSEQLPTALKWALARRFWGHDGSLLGDQMEFGPAHIPYLDGLADGGIDGAAELIAAIQQHGIVELWIR